VLPRTKTAVCDGLRSVAERTDTFLVDQWGVLHDGTRPYAGALTCLKALRDRGKNVVVISNSGKRAADNARRLTEIGFPPDSFRGVVTSGELTWQALKEPRDRFFASLGRRCLLLSRGGDRSIVEGLPLQLVETAAEADFVLLSGSDAPEKNLADYDKLLAPAAERKLPLICANPDVTAITAEDFVAGPGAIARRYQDLGGQVRCVGKPDPEIFEKALAEAGHPSPARVAVIGDSLQHDIAGGRGAGLTTVLVTGGIHRPAFETANSAEEVLAALEPLAEDHGLWPDWVVPAFRW